MVHQAINGFIDMAHAPEGGGGSQLHYNLRVVALMSRKPAQGMLKDRQISCVVLRALCRAQEGRLSPVTAGDGGDLVVVGGDDQARDCLRRQPGSDAVSDQRVLSEGADVLTRDGLRAASGGDKC